ncbi:hypothetical protein HW555_012425, partial [Spodoptera exigua]
GEAVSFGLCFSTRNIFSCLCVDSQLAGLAGAGCALLFHGKLISHVLHFSNVIYEKNPKEPKEPGTRRRLKFRTERTGS